VKTSKIPATRKASLLDSESYSWCHIKMQEACAYWVEVFNSLEKKTPQPENYYRDLISESQGVKSVILS